MVPLMMKRVLTSSLVCVLAAGDLAFAQQQYATTGTTASAAETEGQRIAPGSKLFIEPMNGFETSLSAAILNKKVPVLVVDDRDKADFVVSGTSEVEKAGWAKTIFISPLPHAEASIAVKDARSGVLIFAYNVDKANARKGNQSTAEACAKHLKEAIEKK